MTARTETSLCCDRDTRPPIDGIRTICGTEFGPAQMTVDQLRHLARELGWSATGVRDYCDTHTAARREETAATGGR